jgi:hypothetical protein
VASVNQEQFGQGDEFVALLPIDFFKVKKDVTPKAPLSVLFKVAIVANIFTLGIGFGLFGYELNSFTVTEESTVSPTPLKGQTCTALGAWTNEATRLDDYVPYRTAVGFEVQIDVSWTKDQCLAATANMRDVGRRVRGQGHGRVLLHVERCGGFQLLLGIPARAAAPAGAVRLSAVAVATVFVPRLGYKAAPTGFATVSGAPAAPARQRRCQLLRRDEGGCSDAGRNLR